MDAIHLKVLQAEMQAQWKAVEDVYTQVEARAAGLRPGDPASLESLAYQLHNLYNAVEDLFKIVTNAFENQVVDLSRWHAELLGRMRLEIEGVRPALVSAKLYPLLDELRAFRHFFRHAYGRRLQESRVQAILEQAREAKPLLERDVEQFLAQLEAGLRS
ncbi:MAG: hypothetical protein EHM56_12760 [Chloroflexi bacterium]|nr:MAG: hypothetical protein EHM56_12760 [Chloroflexota bacterium]